MAKRRCLIVNARFYEELADELVAAAHEVLSDAGVETDQVNVPGVLEIPAAIAFAAGQYDCFVALGVVIRGETTHYDIVANDSARAIMDLTTQKQLAIGNGILTVENGDQAWARADRKRKNKGAGAAEAALAMMALRDRFAS